MKPEHFIYKSDGLYYMQNVPVMPYDRDGESLVAYSEGMKQYYKALGRAKVEAVKCDIKLEVKAVANAMIQGVIKSDKDWIEGKIYTINMEEKIEIYTQYINPCVPEKRCLKGKTPLSNREDWCKRNCELAGMERFARIAAPKKDHDHECTMDLMTDVCVYSCECGKIEVASNLSYHDKPKTYIPESEPKKEEETKSIRGLFNIFAWAWISCTGAEEDKIIEAIKEKFEIKRKPL